MTVSPWASAGDGRARGRPADDAPLVERDPTRGVPGRAPRSALGGDVIWKPRIILCMEEHE
jgi:hypothetical protein